MKILKFSPIKREQGRNTCHCYKETDIYGGSKKPISFTVDPDTKSASAITAATWLNLSLCWS